MGDERDHGGPRLNEGQEAVVANDEGPLLVLGVAGSGRTEALARRVARLVGEGERALVLTRVSDGKGAMPAFKDRLTSEQIQNVADYVSSVAGGSG